MVRNYIVDDQKQNIDNRDDKQHSQHSTMEISHNTNT